MLRWKRFELEACDPHAMSWSFALCLYYLGAAEHTLRRRSGEYGFCHVWPGLRGYDWLLGRPRQPMVFTGATTSPDAPTCSGLATCDAHDMSSDAGVWPVFAAAMPS